MAADFIPTWSDEDIGSAKLQIKSRLEKEIGKAAGFADDAPRALKFLRDNWKEYDKRVTKDCSEHREQIIKNASESPANLYVYLITKVIFRRITHPSMEASTSTIWKKMPGDARYIYQDKLFIFEKVFNPEKIRDYLRWLFGKIPDY